MNRFSESRAYLHILRKGMPCTHRRQLQLACQNGFFRNMQSKHSANHHKTFQVRKKHIMTVPPKTAPFKAPFVQDNSILVWSNKEDEYIKAPNIWLRDNCQCSSCVHEATKQRLLDTFAIPKDIDIESCAQDDNGIRVTWNDGHESYYTNYWLGKSGVRDSHVIRGAMTDVSLWTSSIEHNPPIVQYEEVMASDEGVKKWLSKIREFGFCYVDGTPITPEATKEVLERIAFIRETHYGGFYDFTSDLASKDTAYTNIALDAHNDNTYFSDPAGLQAFHLLSHTQGEGGSSLLVDGFRVAEELARDSPKAYEMLSEVNIHAHASGNDGISIQPYQAFPVLLHEPKNKHLVQVRWNSSDRAAVDTEFYQMTEWYNAARKWAELLKSPKFEYWCQLTPGRLLVFDNWRVLHGRSAFTGERRICGAYINRDDWISRFRSLNWGHDEVLKNLAIP